MANILVLGVVERCRPPYNRAVSPPPTGHADIARSTSLPLDADRRVTIREVAREAGVSISAVSKVLRDAYGVSPAMRAKVTESIERLGYRPHAGARTLRGSSYTIGVLLVSLSSPLQPEIASSVTEELEPTPYQGIFVTSSSPERQRHSIQALVDRQMDGLILLAPSMEASWLEQLGARVPTVVIARHGGGNNFDTVVDDDVLGSGLVVDYLVELGHRSIAHTSEVSHGLVGASVLSQTARCAGYEQAMRRHGLTPEVILGGYSESGGHRAASQLLARAGRPTAIFAGADIAAFGVLRAAENFGLQVPRDLSVTGYDNVFAAGIGRVSLTTVDQNGALTGSISVRLLLERIGGRVRPVHHVVTPRLLVRGTAGPPPSRVEK